MPKTDAVHRDSTIRRIAGAIAKTSSQMIPGKTSNPPLGNKVAARYARAVARVAAIESERIPGSTVVTDAVARGLHKLTAYKDEIKK